MLCIPDVVMLANALVAWPAAHAFGAKCLQLCATWSSVVWSVAQAALDKEAAAAPTHKLAIDIRIDDAGRGTVSSCRLEAELPDNGF